MMDDGASSGRSGRSYQVTLFSFIFNITFTFSPISIPTLTPTLILIPPPDLYERFHRSQTILSDLHDW